MKKLTIILLALILFSCKKEVEPKTLVITNKIQQSQYSRYDNPRFVERVGILYYGADHKTIKYDKYPIAYSTVKNLNSYVVTSTPLQDDIVSMVVLVHFYYTSDNLILIEYQSEKINIREGLNTYTITENDKVE